MKGVCLAAGSFSRSPILEVMEMSTDADVRAALDTLNAERANLSPEGQAALDVLKDKLDEGKSHRQ